MGNITNTVIKIDGKKYRVLEKVEFGKSEIFEEPKLIICLHETNERYLGVYNLVAYMHKASYPYVTEDNLLPRATHLYFAEEIKPRKRLMTRLECFNFVANHPQRHLLMVGFSKDCVDGENPENPYFATMALFHAIEEYRWAILPETEGEEYVWHKFEVEVEAEAEND